MESAQTQDRWKSSYVVNNKLPRDQKLFSGGPKRILALDGGGIRGLISLGILSRIEAVLQAESGKGDDFCLADYFDLIAGTSTGSIIAAGLALGWRVSQVKELYEELGPSLFPSTRVKGVFKFKRNAEELKAILEEKLKGITLESEQLVTGLMICAKRIDTDSAWVLTNNPKSRYWESEGDWIANKEYQLSMLVRASAAAPTYFEPVRIQINKGKEGEPEFGLFVDGAISGHNNPAVQSIMTATLPSFGFGEEDENGYPKGWESGPENLLVINVGTGWYREEQNVDEFASRIPAHQALTSLKGIVNDTVRNDLLLLQAISNPTKPWYINSEVNRLHTELAGDRPLISYQRYDANIDKKSFLEALNLDHPDVSDRKRDLAFKRIKQMDNGAKANIRNCFEIGKHASAEVELAHFPSKFNEIFAASSGMASNDVISL